MDSNPVSRATSLSMTAIEQMLPSRLNDVAVSQEQLTTGLRINRPSDDATGFYQTQQLEALEARFNQFEQAITSSRSWLDHTQNNLNSLADIFSEAYQEGVRSVNSTLQDAEREDIARLLEDLTQNILELLNAQNNDEYIHSGTRTAIKPFAIDSTDPTADGAGVVYFGNAEEVLRQIGPDATIDVNITGEEVWNVDEDRDGTTDFTITESIQNFIDALRANDVDAMTTGLSQIEGARDHIINLAAQTGSSVNRLDLTENQLTDAALVIAQQKSEIQDTDFAEAIVEFQRAQTSLQTSLQITGTILQTSLLNFI